MRFQVSSTTSAEDCNSFGSEMQDQDPLFSHVCILTYAPTRAIPNAEQAVNEVFLTSLFNRMHSPFCLSHVKG